MTEDHFVELTIKEATAVSVSLVLESGLLGTHSSVAINHRAFECDFTISVSQNVTRKIEIKADAPTKAQHLWMVMYDVIRLCMLFDGQFFRLESGVFYLNEEKTDWSDELVQEYLKRSLPIYTSADFTKGSTSFFICPLDVLSSDVLNRWIDIESELEIVHPMVLYAMSNLGVPVDLKAAILVEAFEPLFELIKKHHTDFIIAPPQPRPNGERDSKLRRILESTIQRYGLDIVAKEIDKDIHSFCQILVNSRNRMFHIKTWSTKLFLGGSESVLYTAKLSLLYRRILLDLMEIDYALYEGNVKENTSRWNAWNGVLDLFLATRWTD